MILVVVIGFLIALMLLSRNYIKISPIERQLFPDAPENSRMALWLVTGW